MSALHIPAEGPKLVQGEYRYRVPVPRALQDILRRMVQHVVDQPASEWGHRGRLDYGRLESLLERLAFAAAGDQGHVFLTHREAGTLLAWTQYVQNARAAREVPTPDPMGTAPALVAKLEYMLRLRDDLPGRVPGQPIRSARFDAQR